MGLPRVPFPPERYCRFLFPINTNRTNVVNRRSLTRKPMAKMSKSLRHPEAPAPAGQPAPRVAPSREAADQRLRRFPFFLLPSRSQAARQIFLPRRQDALAPEMVPQGL